MVWVLCVALSAVDRVARRQGWEGKVVHLLVNMAYVGECCAEITLYGAIYPADISFSFLISIHLQ